MEAGSSLRSDEGNSDVALVPSSDLDYQNGNTSLMQKGSSQAHVSEGSLSTNWTSESLEGRDKIPTSSRQEPAIGKGTIGAEDKSDHPTTKNKDSTVGLLEVDTDNQLKKSNFTIDVQSNHESGVSVTVPPNNAQVTTGESTEDATSVYRQGGLKLLISSNEESVTSKESDHCQIPEHTIQKIKAGGVHPAEVTQHIITKTKLKVHTIKDASFVQGIPVNIFEDFNQVAAQNGSGKDTIINVDKGPVETTASQRAQDLLHAETEIALNLPTQTRVAEHGAIELRKAYEIEVIKSVVYGGLAESITSPSVVSAAAGGDATTLNILALGMANVIGGLSVIGYNLWQIKSDCTEPVPNQVTKQGDHYRELLGRRQNFVLHATVVILSYLIFGLVPPVVYGFSFRKNYDKELKLVVVAVASLLCIAVLAIGKVYIRRPPKSYLKTVVKFVVLGFMVSGVSYAAGGLIKRLLERLGLFESSSVANLLLPEVMTTKLE
ncbi:membrane protein of ER body-like protein [Forsythia ovata]|uniref:Membrane protein of ER body-like protein n=1 Tax=Forsythia ovata TaxID=205694 RepID=A0ABD1X360_9LAMI